MGDAMNTTTHLLQTLQALELELHHPGVPLSIARLEELLHPDFCEVGRSGQPYDRPTIVRYLGSQPPPQPVESDAFELALLAPGVALLTFRSALRQPNRRLTLHTLRSSLWLQTGSVATPRWQLRHHQGTPAAQPW